MRTVRDVMYGDIEVLRTTESAADAAWYLAAHDVDEVPLCLADGSLAGSVTCHDIVVKVVAKGLDRARSSSPSWPIPPTRSLSTSTRRSPKPSA